MNDVVMSRPSHANLMHAGRGPTPSPRLPFLVAVVVSAAAGFLMSWSRLVAVCTTGAFFDTDDAMRMVQVRDLAAGQGWYDLTAYRLDPPAGVFMHWSRVIDVPILLLVKLFGVVADPATAERLARLAFPLLLTVALYLLLVPFCERLLGREMRWPALALTVLSGPATGQFEPGRIDHHSAQIVLLVGCIVAVSAAFAPGRERFAALAGAAVCLSLAISIENVPFFVAIGGTLAVCWIIRGAGVAKTLLWFAAGLAVAMPLVYAATIAPSRWALAVGDALSLPQACAVLAAAAFFGLLAHASVRTSSFRARAGVAGLAGIATLGVVVVLFPILLRDPFYDLDPLVRTLWLDHVAEAQPILRKMLAEPATGVGLVAPALLGVLGALRESFRPAPFERRATWSVLAIAGLAGLVASLMMVRMLASVAPLAVPGALAVAWRVREALASRHRAFAGPFAAALVLLLSSEVGWAMICGRAAPLLATAEAAPGTPAARRAVKAVFGRCSDPRSFAFLAELPKGLVLAEPDLGSFILAHTHHSALAGAYHRDEAGIKLAMKALLARPEHAQTIAHARGVRYLVLCPQAADIQYLERSPQGLASVPC